MTVKVPDALAEDLSALLDGELSDERRRVVEAELAASPNARALLAEMTRVQQQVRSLQRLSAPRGVYPVRRSMHRTIRLWSGVAAAAAGLMLMFSSYAPHSIDRRPPGTPESPAPAFAQWSPRGAGMAVPDAHAELASADNEPVSPEMGVVIVTCTADDFASTLAHLHAARVEAAQSSATEEAAFASGADAADEGYIDLCLPSGELAWYLDDVVRDCGEARVYASCTPQPQRRLMVVSRDAGTLQRRTANSVAGARGQDRAPALATLAMQEPVSVRVWVEQADGER